MDFAAAGVARDLGIDRASANADRRNDSWNDRALSFLRKWLSTHDDTPFFIEEVRVAATAELPEPPDGRAWGGVAIRAVHAGLIKSKGYGQTASVKGHRSPKTLWVKC